MNGPTQRIYDRLIFKEERLILSWVRKLKYPTRIICVYAICIYYTILTDIYYAFHIGINCLSNISSHLRNIYIYNFF